MSCSMHHRSCCRHYTDLPWFLGTGATAVLCFSALQVCCFSNISDTNFDFCPHSVTNPQICPPAEQTEELKTIILNGKKEKEKKKRKKMTKNSRESVLEKSAQLSFVVSLRKQTLTSTVASLPTANKREEPHSSLL